MPTQKEELQLNTQQDMSSEDMYVLKELFTEYVSSHCGSIIRGRTG